MREAVQKFFSISGSIITGAVLSFLYFHPGDIYLAYKGAADLLVRHVAGWTVMAPPPARAVIRLPLPDKKAAAEKRLEITDETGWSDTFPNASRGKLQGGNAFSRTGRKPGSSDEAEPSSLALRAIGKQAVPDKTLTGGNFSQVGGKEGSGEVLNLIPGEVAGRATGSLMEKQLRLKAKNQRQKAVILKKAVTARYLE